MRHVIQISTCALPLGEDDIVACVRITVLCDDGSMYSIEDDGTVMSKLDWVELPPIPQDV